MELLLEACINVQQLQQRRSSLGSIHGTVARSVYHCARVVWTEPVGTSILRTVVRNAYRSATVVATEAIGVIHSWNCCSTLTSMCKSCINGRHRCAPLIELLLDALYHCATLVSMGAIGALQSSNASSKRVSLCNSCSNGSHLHAPFVELSPEARIIVKQL